MSAIPSGSVGRASLRIGVGTFLSRATGIVRTVVLVLVIGSVSSASADAFTVANQLPNSIYTLLSVGVLSAVLVPRMAAERDDRLTSKLITLGGTLAAAATVVAAALSPLLMNLQLPHGGAQAALATGFALWCVPQVFFYGMYAVVGEALNARGVFGPHAWAPIANNITTTAGLLVIGAVCGTGLTEVDDWSPTMIAALGCVMSGGIAIQLIAVCWFWRRSGFLFRVDFHWRGFGLRTMGYSAGWTLLMAVASLATGLIQNRIVNSASGEASAATVLSNAWLIFMLPFSLIVVSIGTPFFTRFSKDVALGNHERLLSDFALGIRMLGLLVLGAAAALCAASVPVSRIFTTGPDDALLAAWVLCAYLIGLLPLAIQYMTLRIFYAHGDTRTPLLFTLVQCVLVVAGSTAASWWAHAGTLPITHLAAAVALTQSSATALQTLLALVLVSRHLSNSIRWWGRSLVRSAASAIPAAAAGWCVFLLADRENGWMMLTPLSAAAGAGLIMTTAIAVYVALLALLRTPELQQAFRMLRRRSAA